jgi:hypothetical protein
MSFQRNVPCTPLEKSPLVSEHTLPFQGSLHWSYTNAYTVLV